MDSVVHDSMQRFRRLAAWLLLPSAAAVLVAVTSPASSKGSTATVRLLAADGAAVGNITFLDKEYGLLVEPDLSGLEPGLHAAHVHELGDCGDSPDGARAGNAGDHYDPRNTGRHRGPYEDGHLGDLPNLIAEPDEQSTLPMLAPRVAADEIRGRALVVHAGADRYTAHATHAHGKGGAKIHCGVIQ